MMVWQKLFGRIGKKKQQSRKTTRRKLLVQELTQRQLLAGDMGAIGGIAFIDQTNNGLTADDTRLESINVELYLDDGDGTFDGGDTLQATDTTGSGAIATGGITGLGSGEYRFDGLAAGTYHVLQANVSGVSNPTPITVQVTNDTGDPAETQTVDNFTLTVQSVTANASSTNTDTASATEAIGGERNISVENTAASGQVTVFVDSAADQLSIGSLGDGAGNALIQYDGADGTTILDASGLGGVSLAGGNVGDTLDPGAGIIIRTRAENAGDSMVVTVYTDATNFSTLSVPIPVNAADFDEVCVLFSDFAVGGGTGADFNNIGAIEMSVGLSPNNDVFAEIIEARTPLLVDTPLANIQLLSLGGVLFEDNGAGANSNNGQLDSGEPDFGAGIDVQLFRRDASDGSLDPATDTPVATVVTGANGTYNFPDLEPDDYLVLVPNSEFQTGQPLFGFIDSTGIDPADDPDNNVDGDDNGTFIAGVGLSGGEITLVSNAEPINDDDTDPNTNTTVDFGLLPTIDLTITKTLNAGLSNIEPGGLAVFDIVVTNLGPLDATGVTVSDVIPTGLTYDAANSDFGGFTETVNGSNVSVDIGNVAAGGAGASFVLATTIGATQFTDVTNSAAVSGNEIETDDTNNTDDEVVDLSSADLVITKTDSTDPVNAGNQFVYTITVTNNGPDTATDVTITDNLPNDVTFVSHQFVTGSGTLTENPTGSGDLTITVGDLANNASASINVTVQVAEDAASPLNNVANVVANPNNDPNMNNNSTTEPTDVQRVVDVAIDKSVTGTPVAGQDITYTLIVTNNGPGEARDVSVSDVLDSRLTFSSFDAQTSGVSINQAGQSLSFDVGTLPSGATRTFSFDASIASSASGVIPNVSTVATTDDDSVASNNTDNVDVTVQNQIDLILEKSVNLSTAVPGQDQLIYTFTVRHDTDSLSDAQNVVVTDVLPSSLTGTVISAATATSTNFDNTSNTATVNFDTIPVGETRTFTITVDVNEDATGTITNPASVGADGTELDLTNNDDTAVTTLNPQFDVTVDKTVNNATPGPGDTVTYTVDVTNSGPSTATGVVLTDDIPAGLTFVSGSMNGQAASSNGTTVSFPAITLADDASQTATLTFTVDGTADGQITNTATVAADSGETNLNNNDDPAVITVTPVVDISITKSVDLAQAQVGSTLVYTVTVTNSGPSTANTVQAVDTLPSGVTFVSGTGPNGETLSASGQTVTVDGGNLASAGSFTFTINATINTGVTADQTNSVTVSTTTNETNLANNSASAVTTVDPQTSSIAGTVYIDANNNGVQDTGEVGIAGVAIALSGTDSIGNAVTRTATTDANGDYLFSNLAAGTYQVDETQPAGFRDGREDAGQGATATVLDDMFTQIGLGEAVNAVEFDFGELNESLSKRRFLASTL